MNLHGRLTELLVKVALDIYSKYVTVKNKGKTILYVYIKNELYGMVK